MTVADILIVALFLYCDMEDMRPMSFQFAFCVWILLICEGVVYLYNALYFGDA